MAHVTNSANCGEPFMNLLPSLEPIQVRFFPWSLCQLDQYLCTCFVNLCHVYMCIHIQFPWFTGGPIRLINSLSAAVFDLASKWSSATTCSNLGGVQKNQQKVTSSRPALPASTIPCEHRDRSRNLGQFTTSAIQAHLRALYPAVSGIPQ